MDRDSRRPPRRRLVRRNLLFGYVSVSAYSSLFPHIMTQYMTRSDHTDYIAAETRGASAHLLTSGS